MRSRILFTLCFISVVVAQPTFTEHVITTGAQNPQSVYALDLDGDGDMDVLSANWDDNTITWYENDGSEKIGRASGRERV